MSLDNNDNADGKIAEFDNIRAMIGVDKELVMDSLNYIDEHFHLISYNLAIKSGIMTLLLLLLSNYSKESAIYNFVKNILLKKTKNLLRNFEPTFPRSKVCNNDTTDSSSVEKETTSPSFLTDSTTNFHKKNQPYLPSIEPISPFRLEESEVEIQLSSQPVSSKPMKNTERETTDPLLNHIKKNHLRLKLSKPTPAFGDCWYEASCT